MKNDNKQISDRFDEAWALSGLDYPKQQKEEYRYMKKFFLNEIETKTQEIQKKYAIADAVKTYNSDDKTWFGAQLEILSEINDLIKKIN